MAEVFTSPDYVSTLEMPGLNIEIYAQPQLTDRVPPLLTRLECLGPHFMRIAREEGLFKPLGLNPDRHTLEVELNWIQNDMMGHLNREYRQKDSPTDVLTFPLISEESDNTPWLHLPAIQLGSVFVSIEWAETEVRKQPELNLERYLLERFLHGMLHLLGQHHDTMADYERVVRIQNRVLQEALGI